MNQKIKDLLTDVEFVSKIVEQEDTSEVIKIFKEKGIDVSENDLKEISDIFNSVINHSEKLDDSFLQNISGGSATVVATLVAIFGLICGTCDVEVKKLDEKTAKEQAAVRQAGLLLEQQGIDYKKKINKEITNSMIKGTSTALTLGAILSIINYYKKDIKKLWFN